MNRQLSCLLVPTAIALFLEHLLLFELRVQSLPIAIVHRGRPATSVSRKVDLPFVSLRVQRERILLPSLSALGMAKELLPVVLIDPLLPLQKTPSFVLVAFATRHLFATPLVQNTGVERASIGGAPLISISKNISATLPVAAPFVIFETLLTSNTRSFLKLGSTHFDFVAPL